MTLATVLVIVSGLSTLLSFFVLYKVIRLVNYVLAQEMYYIVRPKSCNHGDLEK